MTGCAYDLLILDCDGTLVSSEHLNLIACSALLAEHGCPQYSPEVCEHKFMGFSMPKTLAAVTAETGTQFPSTALDRFVELVRALAPEHFQSTHLARETLDRLAPSMRMCVASNGEPANVLDSVTWGGFLDLIPPETIFTASEVAHPKPAPDLFLHAAKVMGDFAPERCVVVEDSVPGVKAAVAAGMFAVGFVGNARDPERQADALRAVGADVVMTCFSELADLVARGPGGERGFCPGQVCAS